MIPSTPPDTLTPAFLQQTMEQAIAGLRDGTLTAEQQHFLRRVLYSRVSFDPDLNKQFLQRVEKDHRQLRSTNAKAAYYDGRFDFQAELDGVLTTLVQGVQPADADPMTVQDCLTSTLTQEVLDRQTSWGDVAKSKTQLQEFCRSIMQVTDLPTAQTVYAAVRQQVNELNAQNRQPIIGEGNRTAAFDILRSMDQAIHQFAPEAERYEAPASGEQPVYISSETRNAFTGRRHGGYAPGSSGGGRRR